jgi:hypothetical protein
VSDDGETGVASPPPGLLDRWTRWRLGRPARGALTFHPWGTFCHEDGCEVARRLGDRFGPPEGLVCADLGCGPVETPMARNIFELPWRKLISVEVFPPYLEKLRSRRPGAAAHEIVEARIETALDRLGPQSVDVALLIDVLEHFSRRDALALLVRLERVARRGIALFSPVGVVPQEAIDANPLQRHRSSWWPEDWLRLGYDVEVYERFHGQLDPPATAAWAFKRLGG